MKRNARFFTIVISLLLLSSIILTGCMYAIASDNGEMKPYDLNGKKENGSGGNTIDDAPTAQLPLMGKFSKYLHEEDNAVVVFSAEQYAELKAIRDNGERVPLTHTEILYLIDDSINLYFTYDVISLYNANVDGVLPLGLTFSSLQSSSSYIITPYHGNFSDFETYSDALREYERMIQEIYAIIYYRIYMHDAGFESVYHTDHYGEDYIHGERYNSHYGMISSAVYVDIYQMLAIDGAEFSGIENEKKLVGEYKTLLERQKMFEMDGCVIEEPYPSLNSDVLFTDLFNELRQPKEYKFYIADKVGPARQIYPTVELENLMPRREFHYEAKVEQGFPKSAFGLDYGSGKFAMSADMVMSFAIIGRFEESDGVLKLYPSNAGDEGSYSYVFHEKDGTWVYSAKDSKPIELAGFDWYEDIVFEKVHEGVSTKPNPDPDPPVNDEKDPDITEERSAYLKYVAGGNYCSLMFGGNGVIDGGSYVKKEDIFVFMFKTADGVYTYYFNYKGDNEYNYAKGQSNPVPGYEFEDETEFVITEFDYSDSCLLEPKKD